MKFNNLKMWLSYTVIFIILILVIFKQFFDFDASFVWHLDGIQQHFAILYDFNETVRSFLKNVSEGVPLYSWEIGLGSDIIGEYSYYVIGDPFAYISFLFPMEKLVYAYNLILILRFYVIGIVFILYCKYHEKSNFNCLMGVYIYMFCGYSMIKGLRHPFFLNAMIMLPLVLLGVDKLLKENKSSFFIFSVALLAIWNYYFLYKITILAFIYACIKYFVIYNDKDLKKLLNKIIKAGLSYILAILIASIILFPTIYAFLNSNRIDDSSATSYGKENYQLFISGLISNEIVTCIASFVLLMLPISILNFKNKEDKENRVILINIFVVCIMLLSPHLGSMMNGFSYQQNRFVFHFVFLLAYMVVINFDIKLKYSKEQIIAMTVSIFVYFILLINCDMIDIKDSVYALGFSVLILLFIIFINNKNNIRKKYYKIFSSFILFIVLLNIFENGSQIYNVENNGFVNSFKCSKDVMDFYNNYGQYASYTLVKFNHAIDRIKSVDNSFYRINDSSENVLSNIGIVMNYKSLNSYLSIGNQYVGELTKDLRIKDYQATTALAKLDSRTQITTLLGAKYYIGTESNKNIVPYGYELIEIIDNPIDINNPTLVYKNKNTLSIGTFFDSYIKNEDYDKLNPIEKENVLLNSVVVDNENNIISENVLYNSKVSDEVKKNVFECNYIITNNKNIKLDEKTIWVNDENESIELVIDDIPNNTELYVYIDELEYNPFTKEELRSMELNGESTNREINAFYNKYKNYQSDFSYSSLDLGYRYSDVYKKQTIKNKITHAYYVDYDEIAINLGYRNVHDSNIVEIELPREGKYKYNDIKILAVSMDSYDKNISKIKENEFVINEYNNNYLLGKIVNNRDGILQFSIPYSKGWKVYIDGDETEIINVNKAFIGINLEEGVHEIYLKYETPYLKVGIICSCISCVVFIVYFVYENGKFKKYYRAKLNGKIKKE